MPSDKKDCPKFDPFEHKKVKENKKACVRKNETKETESKKKSAIDPCEKLHPSKMKEISDKKPKSNVCKPAPPPASKLFNLKGAKEYAESLKNKLKFPSILKDKIKSTSEIANSIKALVPKVNVNDLKNIEYRRWLKYGICKLNVWIRENCNLKKMADKGSGAPSRPMKYPYTFSAKMAQFPFGFYVKNQWVWKYYAAACVVCVPIFYSISKLANSPGNVAKWAEIRRKEAAEHHH